MHRIEATAHCTTLRGGSGSFALYAGEPLFVGAKNKEPGALRANTEQNMARRLFFVPLFFVLPNLDGSWESQLPSARTGRVGWLPVPYTRTAEALKR